MSTHFPRQSPLPPPLLPEFSSPTFSLGATFNPKSVTEASVAARSAPPKPPPSRPFFRLDLNNPPQRPPFRNRKSPVSKRGITWTRYGSVVLRIGQLLGAMGLLVTMLLIRSVDEMTGWICRIPPAVAIVHTLYAIYHLSGSYRLKTPGSSKVYFLFASSIDLAIISFYSIIGVLSWRQRAAKQWTTIFHDDEVDKTLVLTVFLLACTTGALTILALGASLYLIHSFRILAALPPDRNPFVLDDGPQLATEEKSKRWSSSTAGSELAAARTIPFVDTRVKKKKEFFAPTPSQGRYSYATLTVDPLDLADARRAETLGGGYDQAPETPTTPTTANLRRAPRMPGTPTSAKRKSLKVESPPGSLVSGGSWGGTSSVVQGYSKAAMLSEQSAAGREWRFRKVSGEAH